MIHEPFRSYGWGGPFEPQAVGPVRLQRRTGCHTVQPKLTGYSKRKLDISTLLFISLPSVATFFSRQYERLAFTGWLIPLTCLEYSMLYLERTSLNRNAEPYGYAATRSV